MALIHYDYKAKSGNCSYLKNQVAIKNILIKRSELHTLPLLNFFGVFMSVCRMHNRFEEKHSQIYCNLYKVTQF